MRPRLTFNNLPPCVYFKHGAFWFVKAGKWLRLGTTLEDVGRALPDAPLRMPADRADLLAELQRRLPSVKASAKARGIPFELSQHDLLPMLEAAKWRCAVTGIAFSNDTMGARRRPYAPSIDRADSRLGYSAANCRVVCLAANLAMNEWGDEVLRKMTRSARVLDVQ